MTGTPPELESADWWATLRRRKVVQWGLVYLAGAWGFLQGLAYVTETFHWPEQVRQIALLAALIGLPLILILAWYHGDRGEQHVRGTELGLIALLFLAGGGIFWLYERANERTTTAPTQAATSKSDTSVADSRPSIAVLPFENRSDVQKDAFFVDGIHDDILTQLSKVSALRVISRTSVERFRKTDLSMQQIAAQLGVKSILEGGVQRAGDRVRINVQLIDAATDAHHWAENYDRELTVENMFAIQSEVAQAIAGALKATLTPAEKVRVAAVPTRSLPAWEAYQLGIQSLAPRTSPSLVGAEQLFRRAIALDSEFALAYVGLSDALRLQTEYSGASMEPTLVKADEAASKALALNPDQAEAWASKAGVAMSRGQNKDAERLLRRAIALNPNYATAHHWLSQVLRSSGSLEEVLEHAERAAQLDPLSAIVQANLGGQLEALGRFDAAAAAYQRGIEADLTSPRAIDSLALLNAYARNRFTEAVILQSRAVALDNASPILACELAVLWLDINDEKQATALIESISRRWPDDMVANAYSAGLAISLGDDAIAEAHASKALALYPRANSLVIAAVRNADFHRGDLEAAQARYVAGYPELLKKTDLRVSVDNVHVAIDMALVSQREGNVDSANALLDASELAIRSIPRLGFDGYGLADAQIHALRGDNPKALASLRDAEKAGWRGPAWRYYRDVDPNLASIRNEPEFSAVFADIERDMARQRAALAARPKGAPLDLKATGT